MHKLILVAIIGVTASAACFGAAAAIGGKDFGGGLEDFSLFDGRPHCEAVAGATAAVRDLDWDGSDRVGLSVLAPATYAPGSNDRLHIAGDPQVLAHMRIRDGNIEMDCHGWRERTAGVTITLPGRQFHKFALNGGGDLTLNNLNQDDVSIAIGGAGKVRANGGKLETVKLAISAQLRSTVKHALATHHKVTATLVGTVVDGAGRTERKSAPVTVVITS